jgi:protein-S-isoprenylcysteine O-methyltransferase Ste14
MGDLTTTRLPELAICLLNLALIGALPRLFFKDGRLNARWWLTASPFIVVGGTVFAGAVGALTPLFASDLAATVGLAFCASSVGLIGFAIGTHRAPPALWHQANDVPARLVTTGAYARVRHPLYLAFLLALTGCTLIFPHWLTIVCLVFAGIQLNRTAAAEERTLLASEWQHVYADYLRRTGRFWPRGGTVHRTIDSTSASPSP